MPSAVYDSTIFDSTLKSNHHSSSLYECISDLNFWVPKDPAELK